MNYAIFNKDLDLRYIFAKVLKLALKSMYILGKHFHCC